MVDDPTKKFSKPVEIKQEARSWQEFQADKGKAREAFAAEQQKKDEEKKAETAKQTETERKPTPPQKNFDMPGPGGAAVRNSVAQQNVRRAKALAAQQKADGLEQEAKRKQAGKEVEIKRVGLNPQTQAAKSEKGIEKSSQDAAMQARQKTKGVDLAGRVERMELAQQAQGLVKSRGEHEK